MNERNPQCYILLRLRCKTSHCECRIKLNTCENCLKRKERWESNERKRHKSVKDITEENIHPCNITFSKEKINYLGKGGDRGLKKIINDGKLYIK